MLTITKIGLAVLFAAMNLAGGSGDPLKIKPIQKMQGGDSKVNYPMVRMIQDQKSWKQLWALHKGQPIVADGSDKAAEDAVKPPEVDFDKNQVLVVFGGHMTDVESYDYVKTYAKEDTAVVQLSQNLIPAAAASDMKHPYILMVIPKEPVAIEVQLDSIAKDGSHFWKTIQSYRAPKP